MSSDGGVQTATIINQDFDLDGLWDISIAMTKWTHIAFWNGKILLP